MTGITKIKNPRFANVAQNAIIVDVTLNGTVVPFVAMPGDPEPHGRAIFQKAAAGGFGAVAPYTPSQG